MAFIKSHSNYVLQSKHQNVKDGTIWERDITTIGGVDQFSPGQIPIYKSSNFIITTRSGKKPTGQYAKTKWDKCVSGDIWTLDSMSEMKSEYEDENDTKIVLKKDYYDFRDFAYYGSLTELFRASINDILDRFPGEMYFSDEGYWIEIHSTIDGNKETEYVQIGVDDGENQYFKELRNPYGIDIFSSTKPLGADPLKYFADGGINNYELIGPCEDDIYDIEMPEIEFIDICCDCKAINGMTIDFEPVCDCFSICNLEAIPISVGRNALRSLKTGRREAESTSASESQGREKKSFKLRLIKDNKGVIHYMHDGTLTGYHIRPKREFFIKFYNECNAFEKLLLNEDSTPKYKSVFSVIDENEFGYFRSFESFIFPTSEGGYNLTSDESFTDRLVHIGEFYDERFTDNLYRSMTHEAIKNFDWTYTREYNNGDEIDFIQGGQKIQKAIRLFAREFDEIKSYIDNIKYMNRLTYDERSNMPDYFLVDSCEENGWDAKYVIPYDLKVSNKDGEDITETLFPTESEESQEGGEDMIAAVSEEGGGAGNDEILMNNALDGEKRTDPITREYSQNSNIYVKPYTISAITDGTANGYFIGCEGEASNIIGCVCTFYGNKVSAAKEITDESSEGECSTDVKRYEVRRLCERHDSECNVINVLVDRIKSHSDETEYSMMEMNNEFLRRLTINSKNIWRHKGTIEGIEMILGMFGLKSRDWLERNESCRYRYCDEADPCKCNENETDDNSCKYDNRKPDYEITEYVSFTKRIPETWDVEHQMYRIDWVNTTKTIAYDNRSQSNYTLRGSIGRTSIPYQGIAVAYRDEYLGYKDDEKYLKHDDGFYYTEKGEKVLKRYLYPNFSKDEQLDGNPYYQMDGGWLSKKIIGKTEKYNFQFDVDDNIVHNKYVEKGEVKESGFIDDNHPLYKETIRNIRRVDTLKELVTIPMYELQDGAVCYVNTVGKEIAVIDGDIYEIEHEGSNIFVTYKRIGGFVKVGDKFFDESIVVYNSEFEPTTYFVDDKLDGYEIKAYIKVEGDDNESDGGRELTRDGETTEWDDTTVAKPKYDFITYNSDNHDYTITSFQVISDETDDETPVPYTNYYILDDVTFCNNIAYEDIKGWRRLAENDNDYLRINTITNYYEGNNGHNGNMVYDNGHEYFTYFNRIFKHAFDNDLIDTRCYTDGYDWIGGEITEYGFSGLIDTNEAITQYDPYLIPDNKIHYFGNYKIGAWYVSEKQEDGTIVTDETKYESANECMEAKLQKGSTPSNRGGDSNEDEEVKYPVYFVTNKIDKIMIYGDEKKYVKFNENGEVDEEKSGLKLWEEFYHCKKEEATRDGESSSDDSCVSGYTLVNLPAYDKNEVIDNIPDLDKDLPIDDVTNQIVNNKRFTITFNMKYPFDSKDGQCELKYIDNIVLNYLTQMIPSTAILDVNYRYCDLDYSGC